MIGSFQNILLCHNVKERFSERRANACLHALQSVELFEVQPQRARLLYINTQARGYLLLWEYRLDLWDYLDLKLE